MFGSKQKRATGIHVGDEALHLVELSRVRAGSQLESVARVDLPAGIRSLSPADPLFKDIFVGLLRQARTEYDMLFQNTYMALHNRSFLLKRRPLVAGGAGENREQLEWEAGQFLSDENGAAAEFTLDFLLTRRFGFVVAARRAAIEGTRSMCLEAGIEGPGFDVAPFALFNALESSGVTSDAGRELLVDMDRLAARLVMRADSELAGVETCRWDQRAPDFHSDDDGDGTAGVDELDPQEQIAIVVKAMERLAAEGDEWRADRIWLTGEGAAQWCGPLAEETSLPAEPLNPFGAVDQSETAPDVEGPAFATAAGLAFRGLAE